MAIWKKKKKKDTQQTEKASSLRQAVPEGQLNELSLWINATLSAAALSGPALLPLLPEEALSLQIQFVYEVFLCL